jgi:hypothetical protein
MRERRPLKSPCWSPLRTLRLMIDRPAVTVAAFISLLFGVGSMIGTGELSIAISATLAHLCQSQPAALSGSVIGRTRSS